MKKILITDEIDFPHLPRSMRKKSQQVAKLVGVNKNEKKCLLILSIERYVDQASCDEHENYDKQRSRLINDERIKDFEISDIKIQNEAAETELAEAIKVVNIAEQTYNELSEDKKKSQAEKDKVSDAYVAMNEKKAAREAIKTTLDDKYKEKHAIKAELDALELPDPMTVHTCHTEMTLGTAEALRGVDAGAKFIEFMQNNQNVQNYSVING